MKRFKAPQVDATPFLHRRVGNGAGVAWSASDVIVPRGGDVWLHLANNEQGILEVSVSREINNDRVEVGVIYERPQGR